MRIIGILSWYDEQPSMLAEAVHGACKVCDVLICSDGAYALFPKARARSHPDQAEAILRAAETENTHVVIDRPADVYLDNEVEKRNHTLRLASAFADDGDWILVWDADYHLLQARPDDVRAELAATDCNAATYTIMDSHDLLADEGLRKHALRVEAATEWTTRTRGIYRWTPDLKYGPAHYFLSGTYDGRTQWIYGPDIVPDGQPFQEPACNLNDALVVYHRRDQRAKVRQTAADLYYQVRDEYGIEKYDSVRLKDEIAR